MSVTHRLKTWPEYFEQIMLGYKNFEIRENDRAFQVGDVLVLREFSPASCHYSGRECFRRVTYITDWEQKPNFVVMGLTPMTADAGTVEGGAGCRVITRS